MNISMLPRVEKISGDLVLRNSDNTTKINNLTSETQMRDFSASENIKAKQQYEENKQKIDIWKTEAKTNYEYILSSDDEEEKEIDINNIESNNNQKKQENIKQILKDYYQNYFDSEKLLESAKNIEKSFKKMAGKLNIPKESYELLEAKKILIQQKRQYIFRMYNDFTSNQIINQKNEITDKKQNKFKEIMNAGKQRNLQYTNNQKKIEKELMKICQVLQNTDNVQDPIEQYLLKKHKVNQKQYVQKQQKYIGYKPSDFRKLKDYKINPQKLPPMGYNFQEADKVAIPQHHNIINDSEKFRQFIEKQTNFKNTKLWNDKFGKPQQKYTNKPVDEFQITPIEVTQSPLKIKYLNCKTYDNYSDIPFDNLPVSTEKELAMQKIQKMTPEEIDRYKVHLVKQQWKVVLKDVVRIHRYTQRSKQEVEQNCKKFAALCVKEVRRRYQKSQKQQKEFQFRAKKLHREMGVYWRRREKELAEIKKRQEKLEAELKKREEEEQEAIKKKKSLEYLMKQAGMFAFMMAKKVGIDMKQPNSIQREIGQTQESINQDGNKEIIYKGKKIEIEIDQDQAAKEIEGLIKQNQQKINDFDQKVALENGKEFKQMNQDEITAEELKKAQQLDFTQVDEQSYEKKIEQSYLLKGNLKNYQLKGLRWLDNLFTQGINGILADEMGLGKTIQSISLLSHICSDKNIWGPFLIIAPASTLYNWQQEIKKFFPKLKVLPYWGPSKQRKVIRKFFSAKNLGHENSVFHAVITSYQLIVSDEKCFHRIPWQYMVLDEAQAIKNINSIRWQTLLSIKARNKLLLTGTPIQNSMAELWALLHFIMPQLFNSHEQFQDWFSKDIEEAAQKDKSVLNQQQLQRLHMILKPFMLRRVKKDVEHEIGKKIEIEVLCELTTRQQRFYNAIKEKLSLSDFFLMLENKQKVENLMNLVMQFRKVCNHPELFERRPNRSTYVFKNPYFAANMSLKFGQIKALSPNIVSPIQYYMPKLVHDEIYDAFDLKQSIISRKMTIWSTDYVYESFKSGKMSSLFSFIRFFNVSFQFLEFVSKIDNMYLQIIMMHYLTQISKFKTINHFNEDKSEQFKYGFMINPKVFNHSNINNNDDINNLNPQTDLNVFSSLKFNELSLYTNTHNIVKLIGFNPKIYYRYIPTVTATTIGCQCNSAKFMKDQQRLKSTKFGYKALFGDNFQTFYNQYNTPEKIPYGQISILPQYQNIFKMGLLTHDYQESFQKLELVDFSSLVADSAKLKYLDHLLHKLKRDGHKVLIFCQMTKMMNILEDFMNKRQYLFFRLDGSTNISDRKDMVTEFQQNPKIFCFLLSTRAGGLGITLTAANVVIFYDNDWNPTMDQQATDRAHRIGQTKDVYVYRMVTKGTIEERIVKRAQQKQAIQSTVYGGGMQQQDVLKTQEVMELLFDEGELTTQQQKMQAKLVAQKLANKKSQKQKQEIQEGVPKKDTNQNEKTKKQKKGTKEGKRQKKGKQQNSKTNNNDKNNDNENGDMEQEDEDDMGIQLEKMNQMMDDDDE